MDSSLLTSPWLAHIIMPMIKEIKDFPGYYVSDEGDVFSAWKSRGSLPAENSGKPWRKMRPSIQKYGHKLVTLSIDGKLHYRWIHRLVLENFIGPCPDGMEGCHNDGNPQNNHWKNLRWDTHKNNLADTKKHGTQKKFSGEKNGMAKLKESDIKEIRRLASTREMFQKDIAKKYGIHEETVGSIHRRKRWGSL
jgi:hypothetical protein